MPASRWIKKWRIKAHRPSKRPDRALFRWPDGDWYDSSATEIRANSRHTYTKHTRAWNSNRKQKDQIFLHWNKWKGEDWYNLLPSLHHLMEGTRRCLEKEGGSKMLLGVNGHLFLGTKWICEENATPRGPSEVVVPPYYLLLMAGAWNHKSGSKLCYTMCKKTITII